MGSEEKKTSKIIRKNKTNKSELTQSQLVIRQKVGEHTGKFRKPNILKRKKPTDPSKATKPYVFENISQKKYFKSWSVQSSSNGIQTTDKDRQQTNRG